MEDTEKIVESLVEVRLDDTSRLLKDQRNINKNRCLL